MRKLWRVAVYEYSRHVFRWRFWLMMIVPPIAYAALTVVFALLFGAQAVSDKPVGVVDQAGILIAPPPSEFVLLETMSVRYQTETEAHQALEAGEIQGYYLLPPDYLDAGRVRLIYLDRGPGAAIQFEFERYLRASLLRDYSPAVAERVLEGPQVVVRMPDGSEQKSLWSTLRFILVAGSGLVFSLAINLSSGFLLKAVGDERQNRTIELLASSLSPDELVAGKLVGVGGICLTQFLFWGAPLIALALLVRLRWDWVALLRLEPGFFYLVAGVLLLAFVTVAALMVAAGATLVEPGEAQNFAILITLPVWLPYLFFGPIVLDPGSSLAVLLSLFPLTAPIAITLRAAVSTVPAGQGVLSVAVLGLCAIAASWLAGRSFRLAMLRSGQRLTLRGALNKWRAR